MHTILGSCKGFCMVLSVLHLAQAIHNLALHKAATQSTTENIHVAADKAVNGIYDDFTHTNQGGTKWWMVDLEEIYGISQIKLFNRKDCCPERLSKITILTSTVDSPGDPNLTSADWITRDFREAAYSDVGTLDFRPLILAQYVSIYSECDIVYLGLPDAALSLAEVEIYGPRNLAYHRESKQSSSIEGYPSSNAVNGIHTDFTQTLPNGIKWWMVTLENKYTIGRVQLYDRDGPFENVTLITILTSNYAIPGIPALSSDEWDVGSTAISTAGTIQFSKPTEAWHVAVFSENVGTALSLAEVLIFEYNYALLKVSAQSTTRYNFVAGNSVDGDLATISGTNIYRNQWWQVDLGQRIVLFSVEVFVRSGTCTSANIECASRLRDVHFLTNNDTATVSPNNNGDGDWVECYQNDTSLGESYKVQCSDNPSPIIRILGIITNTGDGVELREVEVYGNELTQLSGDIDGRMENSTNASITVSFLQWNRLMIGAEPPSKYTIVISGSGEQKVLVHDPNSQRLFVTFDELDYGQKYTFTVSCTIQNGHCPGQTPSFTATTLCAVPKAPDAIVLSSVKGRDSGRERWIYNATWEAPDVQDCEDEVQYSYGLVDQFLSSFQTQQTSKFYIDGDEQFQFIVRSRNRAGISLPRTKSGRSGVLKPQFGDSQFTLVATNSSCLALSWQIPQYPGGTISGYQYQCGESELNQRAPNILVEYSCGYNPNTEVKCKLVARNEAGDSTEQVKSATTHSPATEVMSTTIKAAPSAQPSDTKEVATTTKVAQSTTPSATDGMTIPKEATSSAQPSVTAKVETTTKAVTSSRSSNKTEDLTTSQPEDHSTAADDMLPEKIGGGVTAGLVLAIIITLLLVVLYRQKRKRQQEDDGIQELNQYAQPDSNPDYEVPHFADEIPNLAYEVPVN